MDKEQSHSSGHETPEACHPEYGCVVLVRIVMNQDSINIKPGKHRGAEIKKLGQIPPSYELEQVHEGGTKPISDEAEVKIRGCEKFVAFPCKGKAS
jgi:hypothetical protein